MIVEGVLSFKFECFDIVYPEDRTNLIEFDNGYILYPDAENCFPFIVCANLGASFEFKSSLNITADDLNFYNIFSSSFKKQNLDNLGIGIWFDSPSQTFQFYREYFGQIPLFYILIPNQILAFSTSLTSLIRMPGIKDRLTPDLSTILQYVRFSADSVSYYTEKTFYNEIKASLPGHITTLIPTRSESRLVIDFDTTKWAGLHRLEEFGESFKTLFHQSVDMHLKGEPTGIASHLSGGLDSSSISAVAKHLFPSATVSTLYATTNTEPSNERHFAEIVAAKIGSIHHEVAPSSNHIELLILYTSLFGHPEKMVLGASFQGTLMKYAAELGAGTLLIGHPGDSIVGSGFSVIQQALKERRFDLVNEYLLQRALNSDQKSLFENWGTLTNQEKYTLFSSYSIFRELPEEYRNETINNFALLLKDLYFETGLSFRYFLSKLSKVLMQKYVTRTTDLRTLAHTSLLKQHSVTFSPYSEHPLWADGVYTTQAVGINEEAFVLGRYYGIKNKFPFYSKELYELSLAVPEHIKFNSGRGRGHLREAMKELLPKEVINRTDKAKFGIYLNSVSLELYRQSQDFLIPSSEVWQYIDAKKFKTAVKAIQLYPDRNSTYGLLLTRAIALSVWLYLFKNNGFVDSQSNPFKPQ